MSVAIKIENLSKLYRLGTVGTGTIAHDLNRWWHRIRGKEDPYTKIGQINDRTKASSSSLAPSSSPLAPDYVWALRDINLEVKQGEVLGIIGRNGAGKSTLLKLLSRVTAPTSGQIKSKGRIASLLEVGTGFHPELTGRENIFLNGAILGMNRQEIIRRLDEIIDFSGCAKYVDTPVKRYSSGMMVRLGFAVAAHLDCEIMVLDEVLAVGDSEFQNKCVGKIKDVSNRAGRTILFVSHNMPAVRSLCRTGVLLAHGGVEYAGPIDHVAERYLESETPAGIERSWSPDDASSDDIFRLLKVKASNVAPDKSYLTIEDEATIEITYQVKAAHPRVAVSIHLNNKGTCAFVGGNLASPHEPGIYTAICTIPCRLLNSTIYTLNVFLITNATEFRVIERDVISLPVAESDERHDYLGTVIGAVRPQLAWRTERVQHFVGVT